MSWAVSKIAQFPILVYIGSEDTNYTGRSGDNDKLCTNVICKDYIHTIRNRLFYCSQSNYLGLLNISTCSRECVILTHSLIALMKF